MESNYKPSLAKPSPSNYQNDRSIPSMHAKDILLQTKESPHQTSYGIGQTIRQMVQGPVAPGIRVLLHTGVDL